MGKTERARRSPSNRGLQGVASGGLNHVRFSATRNRGWVASPHVDTLHPQAPTDFCAQDARRPLDLQRPCSRGEVQILRLALSRHLPPRDTAVPLSKKELGARPRNNQQAGSSRSGAPASVFPTGSPGPATPPSPDRPLHAALKPPTDRRQPCSTRGQLSQRAPNCRVAT